MAVNAAFTTCAWVGMTGTSLVVVPGSQLGYITSNTVRVWPM